MRIPRAVAVVVDGQRVLLIKRYLRLASSAVCAMCEDAGRPGPDAGRPGPDAGRPGSDGPGHSSDRPEHRPGCPGHRYAVLPGGHVEDGETAAEAALRELAEETGLRATIDRRLWTGRHNGRPAFYFLMRDVEGVPVLSGPEAAENGPDNSFELRWVTADQFAPLNLHPAAIRPALADLLT